MRKLFYTFLLALLSAGLFGQTHVVHKELGQQWGGGASVDIDADGRLDFFIAGWQGNPQIPLLDEDGNPRDLDENGVADSTDRWQALYLATDQGFVKVPTNLLAIERVNLDWYDINGDGYLDVFAAEHHFDPNFWSTGFFENNGDGTFTRLDFPFEWETNAGAFADFNNDGYIDYVAISRVLGNSFVYINQGDNTFEPTNGDVFGEYKFGIPYLEVIDFNNDGLPDIFITSNCDNPEANAGARVICDIFINNDEEPGTFYRAFIGDNGVFQKGNGGVDFADFNNDGWLDFALHGEGGEGTGEPVSGDIWACISHVYINQKDGTFLDKPQPAFIGDIRPLNSSGVGTGTIDWDNDGHYDLIITGWAPNPGPHTQAGYLYKGDGAGNFTEVGRVPGASETVLLFNDWNGDGVKDFLVSGYSSDRMWYPEGEDGRTAAVYFNTNTASPNVRPSAPSNLSSSIGLNTVTLSWDAATDDKTPSNALTYEYYLKDGAGNYRIAPASHVGGSHDGVRMVNKLGNVFLNKQITLNGLEPGNYSWSVQAIDASYDGSLWAAEASFTVTGVSVEQSKLESLLKVYSQRDMLVVKLQSEKPASVSVYNLSGQLIDSRLVSGEYRTSLMNGVYIVKVTHESEVAVNKVLVAR